MINVRVLALAFFSALSIGALAQAPEISGAWVRAMPPGQPMTAVYLEIHNLSSAELSVLGVTSDAGMASLHETRTEGGQSSMRPVSSLALSAGETLVMEPGGLHIMLMGLKTTPPEGSTVRVCVQTSAGEICTDAPVRHGAPSAHDHH
ncbi:MAG: copper chaperone PCu(A)C [Congregibacter sp.]|nr:copper chaperone PCu(A)C [Congregibacter sp.]